MSPLCCCVQGTDTNLDCIDFHCRWVHGADNMRGVSQTSAIIMDVLGVVVLFAVTFFTGQGAIKGIACLLDFCNSGLSLTIMPK
eukprot:7192646-Pyramimonas_sp.AAC.2